MHGCWLQLLPDTCALFPCQSVWTPWLQVMACPSGCLNGGGQLKPQAGQTPQQLIEQLELTYHHSDIQPRHPTQNPAVQLLYKEWVGGPPGSDQARTLLHTTYRKRENKAAAVMMSDW